jgi:hypothetical protein
MPGFWALLPIWNHQPRIRKLRPNTRGDPAGPRLRTWKLIRSNDPVLRWEDILWSKNMIFPRHEVAKQTRAEIGANTLRLSGPRQGSYSSVDPATADYVYPGSVSYQKYDCPADYYNVASRAEKVFFTMSSGDTVLRGRFNTQLHTGHDAPGVEEALEAEHWTHAAFYPPMILFDNIVQVGQVRTWTGLSQR